jgi:predicted Ser/Thr protein kinase
MDLNEAREILYWNCTKPRSHWSALGRNPPTNLFEFLMRRFKANASFGWRRRAARGIDRLVSFKTVRKCRLPQHPLEHETANQPDNGRGHWNFRRTSGGDVRSFLETASDVLHDLARRPLARRTRCEPGRARLFAGPNHLVNRIPICREGRVDVRHVILHSLPLDTVNPDSPLTSAIRGSILRDRSLRTAANLQVYLEGKDTWRNIPIALKMPGGRVSECNRLIATVDFRFVRYPTGVVAQRFSRGIIAPQMPLAPGTKLGPYEIGAPLGAGGMGEVYRAKDTRLGRSVAVKILPAQFSADPVRRQRFEREAKIISSLNHPNICTLHDVGSQNGMDYLVMEYVEGETLAKRLEKGPLPLEQVLNYGEQIADALDKAHRSGVVHRDLKPGNIVLSATGAKLLDFGLAKPVSPLVSGMTLTADTPIAAMTEEGTIVGTFQYMSPEQIEGKELDGCSDIFSLGAVLYEMVTGKRAFQGKSQISVASAILQKEPEPISTAKPLTPPALDHAIRKCLAKLPNDRWQSASDLASE